MSRDAMKCGKWHSLKNRPEKQEKDIFGSVEWEVDSGWEIMVVCVRDYDTI